ncbi:hypothetical protein [Deinococcus multiflagellatus]|uniref:Uncharacterized protein n=1 Tax=Deinococcus multiflagellatus TaxID=1656887 RepID=A0ABW1ZQC8_9DEIO
MVLLLHYLETIALCGALQAADLPLSSSSSGEQLDIVIMEVEQADGG